MTAIGIGLEWHSGHPKGLWMGVAPSHLGLLRGGATLTSERQDPLSQGRTVLYAIRPKPSAQLIRATRSLAYLVDDVVGINRRLGMNAKCRQLFKNAVKAVVLWSCGSSPLPIAAPENCHSVVFHTGHVISLEVLALQPRPPGPLCVPPAILTPQALGSRLEPTLAWAESFRAAAHPPLPLLEASHGTRRSLEVPKSPWGTRSNRYFSVAGWSGTAAPSDH